MQLPCCRGVPGGYCWGSWSPSAAAGAAVTLRCCWSSWLPSAAAGAAGHPPLLLEQLVTLRCCWSTPLLLEQLVTLRCCWGSWSPPAAAGAAGHILQQLNLLSRSKQGLPLGRILAWTLALHAADGKLLVDGLWQHQALDHGLCDRGDRRSCRQAVALKSGPHGTCCHQPQFQQCDQHPTPKTGMPD